MKRYFLAIFCTAFIVCMHGSLALAMSVENIRFGLHPDKTRMVLDMSQTSDFRVFTLADPYRIVIDLPAFDWHVGSITKPGGSGIGAIRQGSLKPGYSRVVIDMDKPVAIKSAFVLPKNASSGDRLVVDFKPVTRTEFLNNKGQVLGTLTLDGDLSDNGSGNDVSKGSNAPATHAAANPAPVPPSKPSSDAPTQTAFAPGAVTPMRKPDTAPAKPLEKPLIIIDAGHGGADPGAINKHNGIKEKNITLGVALELKKQLEATGRYKVAMTRASDKGMRLYDRVDYARSKNADLFISLHADSISKPGVRGASVYTLSNRASDEQTARLAAKENSVDLIWGVKVDDADVEDILLDLATTYTKNQSNFFANTIVSKLNQTGINTLETPHRSAGFAVLKAPDIPSVLVEMGFISNSQEAQMLNKPEYKREIARALVNGVDAYFEKVHRDQRS